MAFIPPVIMLLIGGAAYLFSRKKRHFLLVMLVALALVFIGTFLGFTMGYFVAGGENDPSVLRALSSGFWWSIFGVIGGVYLGRKKALH